MASIPAPFLLDDEEFPFLKGFYEEFLASNVTGIAEGCHD